MTKKVKKEIFDSFNELINNQSAKPFDVCMFIYSLPAVSISSMLVQLGDLQVKMDSRVPGEWYHSKGTIYYDGEITY